MKFKVEKGAFAEQLAAYADELKEQVSDRLKQIVETVKLLERSTIVLSSTGQLVVVAPKNIDAVALTHLQQLAVSAFGPAVDSLVDKYGKFRIKVLKN